MHAASVSVTTHKLQKQCITVCLVKPQNNTGAVSHSFITSVHCQLHSDDIQLACVIIVCQQPILYHMLMIQNLPCRSSLICPCSACVQEGRGGPRQEGGSSGGRTHRYTLTHTPDYSDLSHLTTVILFDCPWQYPSTLSTLQERKISEATAEVQLMSVVMSDVCDQSQVILQWTVCDAGLLHRGYMVNMTPAAVIGFH